MIRIYNATNITRYKPNLKLAELSLGNKKLGSIFSLYNFDSYNPQWITAEIRGKYNRILGKEIFSINKETSIANGAIIEVDPEYRNKDFRIGEILRLSSIINIMENEISEFHISSKPTAVFFHTKYKFEPNITDFDERDKVLSSIQNNSINGFENFVEEAKKIKEAIAQTKDNESQKNFCKQTNELLSRYLQQVISTKSDYKKHQLSTNINMKLTRERILKNKNFFNSLFINHGIDYRI